MTTINFKYSIGDKLYIKLDPAQKEQLILGMNVRPENQHTYLVSDGEVERLCYEMELSTELDTLKRVQ